MMGGSEAACCREQWGRVGARPEMPFVIIYERGGTTAQPAQVPLAST